MSTEDWDPINDILEGIMGGADILDLKAQMRQTPLFVEHDGEVVSNPDNWPEAVPVEEADVPRALRENLKFMGRVQRKPQKSSADLWGEMVWAFGASGVPMTVRQMYYALVTRGAIPKTESAYNRVCYHLLKLRRMAVIPYEFVADNTRWMRKPNTYEGLDAFLEITKDTYRRMLWQDQPAYVEVWCEKDALAGVLYQVTAPWDVPLMVTRGYPSESFLYEAAEAMKGQNKRAHIYYFGDHDPSGQNIAETTRDKLRDFGATFEFHMEAVTPEQIQEMGLPTRPTKKSDSRAKDWQGGSVELDAIPPQTLREMVQNVIEQHIDQDRLERTRRVEEQERATLETIQANLG